MMKPNDPDAGADGKPQHPISASGAEAGGRQVPRRGPALQHGHGLPGLDPQLRAPLLARRRRHPSRLLFAERRLGPDPGRGAAFGDAAAADAVDPRGRHDLRLLRRRAVEPAGGVHRHRRSGDHRLRDLEGQSGEGLRHHRRIRREISEHDARHHQGADPRRQVARRERQRQPRRGGRDPVELRLCRRRRRGDRQLDDRHLRIREGRQAAGPGLQRLLPLLRDLSLLLRRRLVPDPDAPLGPDRRGQPDGWYDEVAQVGLPPGHLSQGGADAGRRRARRRGRLPLGHRRLPRADRRVHRRHHLRRPQAQRLHRLAAASA